MNWTSIIVAGVVGAIAGVLARVLKDPKEDKQGYGITFAVIFGALYVGSKFTVLPWIEMRQIDAELQKNPAFKAIKTYDREDYDKLFDELKALPSEKLNQQQVMILFRDRVMKLVLKRLPTSSDEATIAYMRAMMTDLDELYARGDDTCHQLMFPRPGDPVPDIQKLVSKEAMEADVAALVQVIETSANDPQEIPAESEVMPSFQPVIEQLSAEYGQDLMFLQNPHAPGVDKRHICEIASGMYGKILAMPEDESGPLLRFLMSQAL